MPGYFLFDVTVLISRVKRQAFEKQLNQNGK